jgi:hypothetical protein
MKEQIEFTKGSFLRLADAALTNARHAEKEIGEGERNYL